MIDAIAELASNMKQSEIHNQIAMAVASKQMDATKAQGDAAVELLNAAVQMSKSVDSGRNFDARG